MVLLITIGEIVDFFLRLTQKINDSQNIKYLEQNKNENTALHNLW